MRGRNKKRGHGKGSPGASNEETDESKPRAPTKDDMARLQKVVGRRLANFGILPNLGLGNYGTVAARTFIRDLRMRIWRDVIIEEEWSAEYAQRVAAGSFVMLNRSDEDSRAIAEVADLLESDNTLWQRWWLQDFEYFRLDIGDELPQWVYTLQRNDDTPSETRLQKTYGGVPWRRYYAWCQYFQRRCARIVLKLADRRAERYVQNFVLPPNIPIGVHMFEPIEAVEWVLHPENPNMALYRFEQDPEDEADDDLWHNEMSLTEITFDKQPVDEFDERKGSPLLAWVFLEREYTFSALEPEAVVGLIADLIPLKLGELKEGVSTARRNKGNSMHTFFFNFDSLSAAKYVAAFMMWYEAKFAERIAAGAIQEPTDSNAVTYMQDRRSGLEWARRLGYVNDADEWTVFAELPLVPTRDGIRFVGTEIGTEPSLPSSKECLFCGHNGTDAPLMRERLNPDLVFCDKICQRAFRTNNQLTMAEEAQGGTAN